MQQSEGNRGGRSLPGYCCHCQTAAKELRPYGPNGALVCFDCAMATPERKAAAERALQQTLDACGDAIAIIEGVGPVPAGGAGIERRPTGRRDIAALMPHRHNTRARA